MSAFDDLKKRIDKNVKGVRASVMSESDITSNHYWLATPCLDLNRILSGSLSKGIRSRNLLAIVGPEHSMKSSFMVLCMANAQKQGYKPVIIDTEGGIDDGFCRRWGLDPSNAFYVYTPWIDEVKSVLAQIKATEDEGYVIGIDSVGGIDRYKSYKDAVGGELKADQGILQKEIRSMLKLFVNICVGQNSIGIASGHYYGKPAQIPLPDQIGGGKAMKLFPSIIVTLKKETVIDDDKKVTGNRILATTIKNRVYPPYQTATVQLDYKTGVQEYAGIIDLAMEAGFIKKSGSWYSYKDEQIGQGFEKAQAGLENFKDDLIEELEKWLENTGYSSFNEEIKEAEEMVQKETKETEETMEKNNETRKTKKTSTNKRRKRTK